MTVFVTGRIKTLLSQLMFLTVVPWEGQYKVIFIVNLVIAIVPTERRAGTESIVLVIVTGCHDQYICLS